MDTPDIEHVIPEKDIRIIFDVSLMLKGFFALSEVVAGIAAFFVSQQSLMILLDWVMHEEFVEDPHDIVANFLLHWVQNFSVGAQHFIAAYLVGHGVVKLWLIIGLLRKKLWYYPMAIVVFGLFVVYQLYRYTFTHSSLLIVITVLDLFIMGLVIHEYRYMRSHGTTSTS